MSLRVFFANQICSNYIMMLAVNKLQNSQYFFFLQLDSIKLFYNSDICYFELINYYPYAQFLKISLMYCKILDYYDKELFQFTQITLYFSVLYSILFDMHKKFCVYGFKSRVVESIFDTRLMIFETISSKIIL